MLNKPINVIKISRIYLNTFVIGGSHDIEFVTWSNGLMKNFRLKNYQPVLSQLTFDEMNKAPQQVQDTLTRLMDYEPRILEITEDALELSEEYLNRKILNPKFRDDALHIALASLSNVDVLVSWNFRHIVHYDKIRLFNAVNIENGLKSIDIYSPCEVTNYKELDIVKTIRSIRDKNYEKTKGLSREELLEREKKR
jgi:hypothetical protein